MKRFSTILLSAVLFCSAFTINAHATRYIDVWYDYYYLDGSYLRMEKQERTYEVDNGLDNVIRSEFYDWHYYRTHLVDGELHVCLEKMFYEDIVYDDGVLVDYDSWWNFDVNECD